MMVALAASPAVVADAQTAEVSAVGEDALPDDATSDGAPTSSSGGTLAAPTLPAPVVPLPIASAGAAVMTPADPSAGQPNVATLPQTATPPLRTAAAERSGEAVPTPAAAADAPAAAGFAERLANSLPAGAAPPRPDAAASQGALLAGVQPTAQPAAAPAAAVATPTLPAHAPTVAAQPGRIGREMGVEIARRLTDGGSELTVRLNPGEMGRIEVKMSFNEHGTLRATVAAESPAALDLLRRDSADLGRALTDAGVRADAQSFRFDTRSGTGDGGQWQRQEQSGGNPSGSGSGRGYAADLAGEEPVYRALRTSGRVDLMA
ncbi:flagellar hook-length control protein FliK [Sphingomonas sp. ac-8]|uniref:flagellar hook-length control protein FliK n=1 Tax=Sphingomonas sp. ac-8 TaxID=3242977 RepID=UPI003A80D1B3